MANAADRFIQLMQKTNVDTVSQLIGLTVNSISPIQLTNGDKLILTEDFIIFSSFIDKTKINVGDKFLAITLNSDQTYFIVDIISSSQELIKYKQDTTDLEEQLNALQLQVNLIDGRVTNLENRI